MKKSGVFLLVMSILSLLPAALRIVEFINILHMYSMRDELQELYAVHDSTVSTYYLLREEIFRYAVIILLCLVPGIFGIIVSIKRGRFAVVCIVIGGLFTLFELAGAVSCIYVLYGNYYARLAIAYVISAIFFALYTAAAAIAFKSRKAV
ncbi:MAG: hypothetical protein HDT25_06700 [Ruminococcus sp.]|nr:hypothetical protein [Ruminococcus sp.]